MVEVDEAWRIGRQNFEGSRRSRDVDVWMRYKTGKELEAVARSRAVESCRGVRPAARLTIRAS